MKKGTKFTLFIVAFFLTVIVGGFYFLKYFFSAFAPPDIKITRDYVETDRDFINGVMIEKLTVDSMSDKGYPVKYTTTYTTSCNIQHPKGGPPEPPSKIYFNKPGKYSWDEDTSKAQFIHSGFRREPINGTKELWWINKFGDYPTCPLKLEKG